MSIWKKFLAATVTVLTSLSISLPTFAAQKNLEPEIMNRLNIESVDTGGTLIFSDSPEYVKRNGVLYTDTVNGDARILFYHLNDTKVKKKLVVIVENQSATENKIEITRGGFSLPDDNFLSIGKATQLLYMKDNFHDTIKLAKGERKLFLSELNKVTLNPNHLIYGMYDFKTSGDVKIFVMMCPPNANPLHFLDIAEILPKDEQKLRGTFKYMNRNIRLRGLYDPEREGTGYFLIGDNETDFFKVGIDATDGEEVVNYGNYGVKYTLEFNTRTKTRYYLSPLGGYYAGAMKFQHAGKAGTILTPAGRLYFGDREFEDPFASHEARTEGRAIFSPYLELSDLGSYKGRVRFEYSPPGASNLPVSIILTPDSVKKRRTA